MTAVQRFVVDLKNADEDSALHGKLGAELSTLALLGINIPSGFVITTETYIKFLEANNLKQKIRHLMVHFDKNDKKMAEHIKNNILKANIPDDVLTWIFSYYRSLGWKDSEVSLFPSPTDPYLKLAVKTNIKGEAILIQCIKEIWASFFEHDLLMHRLHRNLSHFRTGVAIIVQKNLYPQKSGYIQHGDIVLAKGPTLLEREEKELRRIEEMIASEYFFLKKTNWIISKGKIYIVGISPATDTQAKEESAPTRPTGRIVTGVLKVINNKKDMEGIKSDDILVLEALKNYDDIKALRHARALVVSTGINNPHMELVLDKMGFPVVVDRSVKNKLRNGMVVTVDATRGRVYQGEFRLD